MTQRTGDARCLTCYGTGEAVTDGGPVVCPDCFGGGRTSGTRMEWRLRAIEKRYRGAGGETEADMAWLVSELRRTREALTTIFARCADADAMAEPTTREIAHRANEVLELYEMAPEQGTTGAAAKP